MLYIMRNALSVSAPTKRWYRGKFRERPKLQSLLQFQASSLRAPKGGFKNTFGVLLPLSHTYNTICKSFNVTTFSFD